MTLPRYAVIRVEGIARPDLDHRAVLAATMAEYEGCSVATVWRRTVAGRYPAHGIERRGSTIRYTPSICLALPTAPVSP